MIMQEGPLVGARWVGLLTQVRCRLDMDGSGNSNCIDASGLLFSRAH